MQKFISGMARTMFPLMILMGFMIVVIGFVIGLGNSANAAEYFAASKAVREVELTGLRASLESTAIWLPTFKFLGLGLILSGIVMALRVIIDRLKGAGQEVMANLPEGKRPAMPNPPWFGPLMPMTMMVALAIFIIAFIVGLSTAAQARALFASPIPDIDAAGAGSAILTQLSAIKTTIAWLVPFKFLGVSLMFTAIVQGLGTIVFILGQQTQLVERGMQIARELAAGQAQKAA